MTALTSAIAAKDNNGTFSLAAATDASGNKFQGVAILSGTGDVLSPALEGAAITGAAMPAGGTGGNGWLSAIWTVLGAIKTAVTGTLTISAATLPLPAGAATSASQGAAQASLTAIAANTAAMPGLGAMTAVPGATANGTALGAFPAGARGVRIYLPTGTAITFTIAAAQPVSAPSAIITVSASTTGPNWDENLAAGQMIYVTSVTGAPLFRWN
jgi:hypothetical protein